MADPNAASKAVSQLLSIRLFSNTEKIHWKSISCWFRIFNIKALPSAMKPIQFFFDLKKHLP